MAEPSAEVAAPGELAQLRARIERLESGGSWHTVGILFTMALAGGALALPFVLKRIATNEVNDVLEQLVARRQPPQAAGREVKLNYATQVETSPPTIAVFGNEPALLQEHYVRYLHNGFRDAWGFVGSPLNIVLRRKGGG